MILEEKEITQKLLKELFCYNQEKAYELRGAFASEQGEI